MNRHTLVFLTAALSTQVFAQDASSPATAAPAKREAQQSQSIDEVIVRGRRMSEIDLELRKFVLEFVDKVAAPAAGRGYARWNRRVCVGVHNLQKDAAQYLVDRISLQAADVGLEPGEPGCQPDVIIIFTTDAQMLAGYLVKHRKRLFLPLMGIGGTAPNRAALDRFATEDRAVRWWAVSMPVAATTGQSALGDASTGNGSPVVNVEGPSRIHSGTRDDLQRVIVIVDGSKLHGTTWQQIADYLAVVSLAQIDPETDPAAFDSILNLFTNPAAYSGLTDWDRSYIRALYAYDPERTPFIQKMDLVNQMAHEARDNNQ